MTASSEAAPRVLGRTIDAQTRCVHYGGPTDIVALKFKCCGDFYPCYECHDETVSHTTARWKDTELGERAVLCGVCTGQLTVGEYLRTDRCPTCDAGFNPGCKLHRDIYFDLPEQLRSATSDQPEGVAASGPSTP